MFQIPVSILSFRPSLIAAAIVLSAATDFAALELAPSLLRPLMIADAMPSNAICSAVFPVSSSIAASELSFELNSSQPMAASLWNTSNPLAVC
ncbi:hypothetical protein ACMD2_03825 [Ananas comosus]|uniref:Uncharacterized protein n=1 Tax=Ananas comosus TaxID=4615 RepID=A0A199UEL9_ANACO|nr:hypothetical protein ACMD2_03825 [Ananas comosus]